MQIYRTQVPAAVLALLFSSIAQAGLINVDFGGTEYTGQGVLGSSSDTTWNSVGFGGFTNLRFADGTLSAVDIATTFEASFDNINRSNALLKDRIIGTSGIPSGSEAETVTLSGLAADTAYDIVVYNGFFAQTYSIAGQGISANTNPGEFSANNNYPWTAGVEYAVLASAMSNSSGELVITIEPFSGGDNIFGENSSIAGLQIQQTVIPVPASVWLFASALGLLGWIRRKSG
jgi:hypothetical protein